MKLAKLLTMEVIGLKHRIHRVPSGQHLDHTAILKGWKSIVLEESAKLIKQFDSIYHV